MKEVLALIYEKKRIYSQSPFFIFLRDRTVSPIERLCFVPCSTPFIMGFTDLCKYGFYQENPSNKIQEILNQHAYEDGEHWRWFINDIEKLGLNNTMRLNDSLEFLWNEEIRFSRLLVYELYKYIAKSEALEKLIILEAIEGIADVFLSSTKKVTDELQSITGQKYQYFGNSHVDAEHDHEAHSDEVHDFIENIIISEQQREQSVYLVEKVFELFAEWNNELLRYAKRKSSSIPEKEVIGKLPLQGSHMRLKPLCNDPNSYISPQILAGKLS